MQLERTLLVAAIKNGTVIDHIESGQALKIIELLRLAAPEKQLTIGLNLPSETMGCKDIIKVQDKELSEHETHQIAIFAPNATISLIKDYEVARKYKVTIPDALVGTPLGCPNQTCITNHEPMQTSFKIIKLIDNMMLHCNYCEKTFMQKDVRGK